MFARVECNIRFHFVYAMYNQLKQVAILPKWGHVPYCLLMTFMGPGSSTIIDRQTEIQTEELKDRSSLFEYCSQVLYSMDFSNCEQ